MAGALGTGGETAMGAIRRVIAKLKAMVRRDRAEREMNREIAAYQAMAGEEGARLPVEQIKEMHRDARSFVWLEQLWQDLRHAARGLRKSPRFTAIAMISLALGIGVNTAIFTLVNGILLKNVAVADPGRIVQLAARLNTLTSTGFTYPVFLQLASHREIFSSIAAAGARGGVLDLDGSPQKVDFQMVTGSFFSFFGARPALGRLIDAQDDRLEGARHVCVISYRGWQDYFNGDPQILRRAIVVNGVSLEVVG